MKKLTLKSFGPLLAAGALFASGSTFAGSNNDGFQPSVARGAALYNQNCGRCHNPRPAEDFSAREWSVIMPHMRAKAHMTRQESLDVEAFLGATLTEEKRGTMDAASSAPASSERGATLVSQFGCIGCHAIKGEGGQMGPSLDQTHASKGAEFIFKKIRDPNFNNTASAMPKFPLNDNDIKSIVKYLETAAQ